MNKTSLVLRVCKSDLTSHYGKFQWPSEIGAEVVAPDWKPTNDCGNGLHGWLHGGGDYVSSKYCLDPNSVWLVLEVVTTDIIDLDGLCKFPKAVIRFVGTKSEAAEYVIANDPEANPSAIIGVFREVGDYQSVMVGVLGTAIAEYGGTAIAGDHGKAVAGDRGTAIASKYGTATTGRYGTASVGCHGAALAGSGGEIHIRYYDYSYGSDRHRTAIGYVGENGIKPDVLYQLNNNHEFVKVG